MADAVPKTPVQYKKVKVCPDAPRPSRKRSKSFSSERLSNVNFLEETNFESKYEFCINYLADRYSSIEPEDEKDHFLSDLIESIKFLDNMKR